MTRSFAHALASHPLFFEPVPPSARISPDRAEHQTNAVVEVVRSLPRIDAVNVPELIDENHEGKPYYRTGDVRHYAREIARRTGRTVVVNKVVAHLADANALARWCEESVSMGLAQVVFIGGSSRFIPYPGPPVIESNRLGGPVVARAGGHVGNVAIPQRMGEAHRMVAKTRAGASFVTTQILCDSEGIIKVLREYAKLCHGEGIAPVPVLLSFGPVIDEGDVEFVRWLGADLPETAERQILGDGSADGTVAAERSISRSLEVLAEVAEALRRVDPVIRYGANVEQISIRHLAHAASMAGVIADQLPR